ncbi:MAG: DJ-1/PfpI family protein [Planctomycetota bacterium]|jgi:4-methyl-5(b-hydroxyethyl)-thiazole monophosphate biosynthesis|nr:DJ-1/PfpI family protein [Planctomycetota bacterium]
MAKRVAVFLADGFEEIEAITPIDILVRAGLEVVKVGVGGLTLTGSHGIRVGADVLVTEAGDGFELLFFPGGGVGAKNLGNSAAAKQLALAAGAAGKWLTAICAAPVFTLAAWGLLAGKKATCYPGMEEKFPPGVIFSQEAVVVDGKCVTSRGVGTALPFALTLVTLLEGKSRADKLATEIVYSQPTGGSANG